MTRAGHTGGRRRRTARRLAPLAAPALIAGIVVGVVGCSLPVTTDGQPTSAQTESALPDGISIGVYQAREDYALRRLEVTVANGTDTDLLIQDLSFSSPQFTAPAVYPKDSATIRAGTSVDLKVLLAEASCDPEAGSAAEVTVSYDWGQTSGTATVTPEDLLDQLSGITAEDCLLASVDEVATITAADSITVSDVDGAKVATLELEVAPTGDAGELTVDTVSSTVLLSLVRPGTAEPVESMTLDNAVSGSTPDADPIVLQVVPTRCDPHVVQEDKRGTFFPLDVTTAAGRGRIFVPVSDSVRGELYRFVELACGW